MKTAVILLAAACTLWAKTALAESEAPPIVDTNSYRHAVRPATIDCVIEAAERANVPSNVLLAIASVENGKNGQTVRNTNGTLDIGHFQINTMHWDDNGAFAGDSGVLKEDVAWRGCYNADVAAWLLRRALADTSTQDYWTRAANYHSRTPKYNRIYRQKLIRFARQWAEWLELNYQVVDTDNR